jgi:hypothetical protein
MFIHLNIFILYSFLTKEEHLVSSAINTILLLYIYVYQKSTFVNKVRFVSQGFSSGNFYSSIYIIQKNELVRAILESIIQSS